MHVGVALTVLLRAQPARDRWLPSARRRSRLDPNRAAVIAAIVPDVTDSRTLKDRIADALDGRFASPETIRQIGQGFLFPRHVVERLIKLRGLSGAAAEQLLNQITTTRQQSAALSHGVVARNALS